MSDESKWERSNWDNNSLSITGWDCQLSTPTGALRKLDRLFDYCGEKDVHRRKGNSNKRKGFQIVFLGGTKLQRFDPATKCSN